MMRAQRAYAPSNTVSGSRELHLGQRKAGSAGVYGTRGGGIAARPDASSRKARERRFYVLTLLEEDPT